MSDNNSSNYEHKLNELLEAQGNSDTQHHVDTKQILSNTWKTNRLLAFSACFVAVTIALVIASGCNVTSASEREEIRRIEEREEIRRLENSNTSLKRVVERAIWVSEACGRRMETGQMIIKRDVEDAAKQVVGHSQFRWDVRFRHPIFRGTKLSDLANSQTLIGQELRKLRDAEQ